MDHIMWVTMTDGGPVVAPVLVDGILSPSVSTAESVAFYDNFVNRTPFRGAAIVPPSEILTSAESTLTVINPLGVPVDVRAAFKPAAGIAVTPAVIEKTVAANATETITYKVEAAPAAGAVDSLPIEWSTRATLSDGRAVTGAGSQAIVIEAVHSVKRRASPVSVDGDLSEWDVAPVLVRSARRRRRGPRPLDRPRRRVLPVRRRV